MLTIGKIGELSGLSTDAIRYYEKEGLIAPQQKSSAGYRLFDDAALRRLRFIKQAQHCGFSLTEIRRLLTLRSSETSCCNDVRTLAIEKKLQLEARIRDMKAMSAALDTLIAHCTTGTLAVDQCTILSSFEGAEHG